MSEEEMAKLRDDIDKFSIPVQLGYLENFATELSCILGFISAFGNALYFARDVMSSEEKMRFLAVTERYHESIRIANRQFTDK